MWKCGSPKTPSAKGSRVPPCPALTSPPPFLLGFFFVPRFLSRVSASTKSGESLINDCMRSTTAMEVIPLGFATAKRPLRGIVGLRTLGIWRIEIVAADGRWKCGSSTISEFVPRFHTRPSDSNTLLVLDSSLAYFPEEWRSLRLHPRRPRRSHRRSTSRASGRRLLPVLSPFPRLESTVQRSTKLLPR